MGKSWTFRTRWAIPSGKHTKNYGKSPFSTGKSTISIAIFNSYVSHYQRVASIANCSNFPEGIVPILVAKPLELMHGGPLVPRPKNKQDGSHEPECNHVLGLRFQIPAIGQRSVFFSTHPAFTVASKTPDDTRVDDSKTQRHRRIEDYRISCLQQIYSLRIRCQVPRASPRLLLRKSICHRAFCCSGLQWSQSLINLRQSQMHFFCHVRCLRSTANSHSESSSVDRVLCA